MAVNGIETGSFGGSALKGGSTLFTGPTNVPAFTESPLHARDVNRVVPGSQFTILTGAPVSNHFQGYCYQNEDSTFRMAGRIFAEFCSGVIYPVVTSPPVFAETKLDGGSFEFGFFGLPWRVFPDDILPFEFPMRVLMGPAWTNLGDPNGVLIGSAFNSGGVLTAFLWTAPYGSGTATITRWNQIQIPGTYNCYVNIWAQTSGQFYPGAPRVPNYTTVRLQLVSVDGLRSFDVTPSSIDMSGYGGNVYFTFKSTDHLSGGFYPQVSLGDLPDPQSIVGTFGPIANPGFPFSFGVEWSANQVGP